MHMTSTRPERRRARNEALKMQQRPGRYGWVPRHIRPKPDRSIYTGNVLQEIERQRATDQSWFHPTLNPKGWSGRQFALKAQRWSLGKLFNG